MPNPPKRLRLRVMNTTGEGKVGIPTSVRLQNAPQKVLAMPQPPPQQSIKSSVATAGAIARDPKHPKREQAEELLKAHQRGWIDDVKFQEILKRLIF